MTTIIMKEHEGGVTIGFDAQTSAGYQNYESPVPKVIVNNGVIFGIAGDVLDANIIQYADLPSAEDAGWDVDRWVTNDLIPAVMQALVERHATSFENNKIETGNTILAAVKGRVYQIHGDTSWVRRTDGTYAVGSGSEYALGALRAGVDIREALDIASYHDMGTGGTMRVLQAEELTGVAA